MYPRVLGLWGIIPRMEWLTAREAAAYLKVAHRTILGWAKTGRIPAHRLSGSDRVTWRFRADELDDAMITDSRQMALLRNPGPGRTKGHHG